MKTIKRKDKGIYVLIIRCDKEHSIKVGALGKVHFKPGYYSYIGSAMNGLEERIKRHLSPPSKKKRHWHIDYLLEKSEVVIVFYRVIDKKDECKVASLLRKSGEEVLGFGCSDCKCKSHLIFSKRKKEIVEVLKSASFVSYIER